MSEECQQKCVKRLIDKIRVHADEICIIEEDHVEDAEILLVAYGITSRVSQRAIEMARDAGIKIGSIRLVTVWPFPEKRIRELSKKVKAFVVPEINAGQIVLEVERCAGHDVKTIGIPHLGGGLHKPEHIFSRIKEALR